MNCHELESVLSDLARSQVMDASLREKALLHTESCACCAQKLAEQRALTDGLRLVAAASESSQAPARVEGALLAAFRKHHNAFPARGFGRARVATRRWLYIAASVAAVAAIVMLLLLTVARTRQSQPDAAEKAQGGTDVSPTAPEQSKPVPQRPEVSGGPQPTPYRAAASRRKESVRPKRVANSIGQSTGEVEIATDFIPVMNGESLSQLEGGQIVRVALPRSALMSFGLPMNMDRANEPVKADVVFGNDGLARAIRFVR